MGSKKVVKRGTGSRRRLNAAREGVSARGGVQVCMGRCAKAVTTLRKLHHMARFTCGHTIMCATCALRLVATCAPRCPACRAPINEVTRERGNQVEVVYHIGEAKLGEILRLHDQEALRVAHEQQHQAMADAVRARSREEREARDAAEAAKASAMADAAADGVRAYVRAQLGEGFSRGAERDMWRRFVLAVWRCRNAQKRHALPKGEEVDGEHMKNAFGNLDEEWTGLAEVVARLHPDSEIYVRSRVNELNLVRGAEAIMRGTL